MANALSGISGVSLTPQSYDTGLNEDTAPLSTCATGKATAIGIPDDELVLAFTDDNEEAAILLLHELNYGSTALCRHRVSCTLQSDGAGFEYDNVSLFWIACRTGHRNVVEKMLQGKPDLNELAQCKNGTNDRTPLMISCIQDHPEISLMLLDAGADPELRDAYGFNASLSITRWMKESESKDKLITELRSRGIFVLNFTDDVISSGLKNVQALPPETREKTAKLAGILAQYWPSNRQEMLEAASRGEEEKKNRILS